MDGEELETYRSLEGANIREPYEGLYSGNTAFGYYERFEFADGVPGLFQKGYESFVVSEDFSLSFYDGQGRGYIVSREGEILMGAGDKETFPYDQNIFDLTPNSSEDRAKAEKFLNALRNRET